MHILKRRLDFILLTFSYLLLLEDEDNRTYDFSEIVEESRLKKLAQIKHSKELLLMMIMMIMQLVPYTIVSSITPKNCAGAGNTFKLRILNSSKRILKELYSELTNHKKLSKRFIKEERG